MSELLKRTDGISSQPVEPSHWHRSQAGGKHSTQQSFILRVDRHLLFELAYMFYRIGTSAVHGERRLVKTSGKLCLFYSPSKGGLRNLVQSLLHDLGSHSLLDKLFLLLL